MVVCHIYSQSSISATVQQQDNKKKTRVPQSTVLIGRIVSDLNNSQQATPTPLRSSSISMFLVEYKVGCAQGDGSCQCRLRSKPISEHL